MEMRPLKYFKFNHTKREKEKIYILILINIKGNVFLTVGIVCIDECFCEDCDMTVSVKSKEKSRKRQEKNHSWQETDLHGPRVRV